MEWRWVCAAVVPPGAVVRLVPLLIPVQYSSVLLFVSCTVPCRVCGVWVGVCLWCSCGGVSSVRSPLTLVVGGAVVDGGAAWWMVGGMMKEGGSVAGLPVECWCSPSVCWCPPCCLPCGPVEGRGRWCVCCPPVSCCPRPLHSVPCFRIGSGTPHCSVLLALHFLVSCCLLPLCVAVLLCCVRRMGGWCVCCGGVCGLIVNVVFFSFSLPSLCLLSQYCWFRVVSCGRVVSLWNGGDGLRVACGVWRLLSTVHC